MAIAIVSPPAQGGVRDYSEIILASLVPFGSLYLWSQNSNTEIEPVIQSDCLYLQYSGYGYAKRGAPLWLLQALERKRHKIPKLGIFFHELYAFGPPWSSAFWLSPVQRHIARRLAELSDFWITNREDSAQWLRRYAGDKPHAVLPVFSTVGEMPVYSQIRARKIVVFGGAGLRLATYRAAGDALFSWARRQALEIHDIGPAITDPMVASRLLNEGVLVHGRLEPTEISRLLADAMFGVVAYPAFVIGKSSVFAAFCAHGVCPVLITKDFDELEGCLANVHFYPGIPPINIAPNEAGQIGLSAWQWYQSHSISMHVTCLESLASGVVYKNESIKLMKNLDGRK